MSLLTALARADAAAGELASRGGGGLPPLRNAVAAAAAAARGGGALTPAETQAVWDAAVKLWVG